MYQRTSSKGEGYITPQDSQTLTTLLSLLESALEYEDSPLPSLDEPPSYVLRELISAYGGLDTLLENIVAEISTLSPPHWKVYLPLSDMCVFFLRVISDWENKASLRVKPKPNMFVRIYSRDMNEAIPALFASLNLYRLRTQNRLTLPVVSPSWVRRLRDTFGL
jgi:hypothetical protein